MVTKDLFSFAAVAAKTLCLVAAAATALSLASCSDDDDDEVANNSIVGTWLYEYEYVDDDGDAGYKSITLTFNSNGTGTATYYYSYTSDATSYIVGPIVDSFNYIYDDTENELTIVLTEEGSEYYYAFFSGSAIYPTYVVANSMVCWGYTFTRQ